MSGQPYVPAALLLWKELCPLNGRLRWPEYISGRRGEENNLAPTVTRTLTLDRQDRRQSSFSLGSTN
jgi:hypothetical protein